MKKFLLMILLISMMCVDADAQDNIATNYAGIDLTRSAWPFVRFLENGTAMARIQGTGGVFTITSLNGSTNHFTVNSASGFVGIGTATPSRRFSVRDNTVTSGSISNYVFSINRQNSETPVIYVGNDGNDDAIIAANNSNLRIGKNLSGAFTEYLRVNTSGSVGIGTSTPRSKLDLNGNGNDILNTTNKIVDADYQDMISVRSSSKASVLNLVSSRSDAGVLGGLLFTTTNGWLDSHANIAGIIGGQFDAGTIAAGYLSFWTKNQGGDIPRENMRITHQGFVGIGTTLPARPLHINNSSGGIVRIQSSTAIWDMQSDAFYSGNFGIVNYTGGAADVTKSLIINGSTGYVGIGNASPDAKLAVSGQIHATEVKVSIAVPGPDYVFEPTYSLPTLEAVKIYIDENKHLPEIPSAKEMEKNGVQLGEMNMLLLKKIEELTLYVIELKKENKSLETKNESILKRVEMLEAKTNK